MPDWTPEVRARLSSVRLSPSREAEIVEELAQHLEQRYRELISGGAAPDEAARIALGQFRSGNRLARRMAELRQANWTEPVTFGAPRRHWAGDLGHDLHYAVRMLTKQRVFGVAAILTLALGIGVNCAIFALVDATVLRPLPLPESERLVMLWDRTAASPRGRVSPGNVHEWNERNGTFERIAAYVPNVGGMVMAGDDGTAETIPRQWVSAGIFDVLGIQPVAGRIFQPSDVSGRANVVVISEAFWRSRFNADRGIVGQSIRLDGAPFTIVGVVPKEAGIIGRSSIWALNFATFPAAPPPGLRTLYMAQAIGRLKRGVTLQRANEDLKTVAEALEREFPNTNKGRGVALDPIADVIIGSELRRTSLLFLGVAGFVLLMCCANVANLLLTRASVRRHELAMRAALGADRSRVIRQLLTESLLLSILGGAAGVLLGAAILRFAPSVIPPDVLPAAVTLAFDLRVLAFCGAIALAVGLLFGLAPAWQATEYFSSQGISSSRTTTGRGGRVRSLIVAGQIATAVMLLFGAGLLLRTLIKVDGVERGYRAEAALTMVVDPPGWSRERLLQFYDTIEREIRRLPGVRSVAWASTLPLGRSYQGSSFFEIVGDPPIDESSRASADLQIVSPSYFQTLDLPVVGGRAFDDRDRLDSVPVCIVNEAFVHRYFQGRSPVGLQVAIRPVASGEAQSIVREIVGVARQVKGRPDESEDLLQIYVPLAQAVPGDIFMLVRPAAGAAEPLAPSIHNVFSQVDRDQIVSVRNVMTLEDIASEATARYRFRAVLIVTFAALAVVLAMVGVFGVLAYSVEQRLRDFGLRRALGATTIEILRLVAASAARLIATGATIGLVVSMAASRLLTSMLFGIDPWDAMTFALVILVLLVTAALSIAGPAWRATRVDPVLTLRGE